MQRKRQQQVEEVCFVARCWAGALLLCCAEREGANQTPISKKQAKMLQTVVTHCCSYQGLKLSVRGGCSEVGRTGKVLSAMKRDYKHPSHTRTQKYKDSSGKHGKHR